MSCDIEPVAGGQPAHRVARGPDPWAWVDWVFAGPDGSFGGRYDDPAAEYRVLYAAASRLGAFMEALAGFRSHPAVLAELAQIEGEEELPRPDCVPREWLERRLIGRALLPDGVFAEIGHSRSLAYLRSQLAQLVAELGLEDLDGAAIRLSAPRAFTQQIGRLAYECVDPQGEPQFAGLRYGSRLGDELHNWALFERPAVELLERDHAPLRANDPDLVVALARLGLKLG
jgi:RES domain